MTSHPPELVRELKLRRALARLRALDDFGVFCRLAWHVIEPEEPYVHGWHVDAIGAHLQAVLDGRIRNLLINMPPRCSKSTLISVLFPAWVWLKTPGRKFLYASYASNLSVRDSIKCRRLIESPWYQSFFRPAWAMNPDQNRQDEFSNTSQGHRIATSVGGAGTGKGADILCVDDPHKATEAYSDTIREAVCDWWDLEMSTRSINPKTVARIVVMQRLHPKDLSGHVLAQGGYEHLVLPMEYEGEKTPTSIGWSDPRQEPGELLSPARFGPEECKELRLRLGAHGYSGQMQQRPAAIEGGVIKRAWFQFYDELPFDLHNHTQAWDFAASEKSTADYTVGGCAARKAGSGIYIVDWLRARMEFPAALQAVVSFSAANPKATKKKIENKSNGTAVIQTLKSRIHGIVEVNPTRDKLSRLIAVAPLIEAGNVFLPRQAPWVNEFLNEVCGFSGEGSGHDDQCDVLTMLLDEFIAQAPMAAPISVSSAGRGRGY